jgi:hypothetical protein
VAISVIYAIFESTYFLFTIAFSLSGTISLNVVHPSNFLLDNSSGISLFNKPLPDTDVTLPNLSTLILVIKFVISEAALISFKPMIILLLEVYRFKAPSSVVLKLMLVASGVSL